MDTVGYLAPTSDTEAQEAFAELEPVARELVREIAVAMDASGELYTESVSDDVIETAQEALFGSLLVVATGPRERFDHWTAQPPHEDYEIDIEGSEHVDRIAWHTAPAAERIVAATYHAEREAAIATLRRIAWGRIYHDLLEGERTE